MIKSGRYGEVYWDPTGATTLAKVLSLNKWKADFKTDKIDVTCFGDSNKVYVPGMKDVSGDFGGFYNSADLTIFEAADQDTPGKLKLVPNSTEATFFWSGLAYMDASIDTSVDGAPAVTGTWMAAGPWTLAQTLAATAVKAPVPIWDAEQQRWTLPSAA